jgi:hypothetical protein
MSQHEQLEVFGGLAASVSDEQPQQSREGEIGERKEHPPMLPEGPPPGSKTESGLQASGNADTEGIWSSRAREPAGQSYRAAVRAEPPF